MLFGWGNRYDRDFLLQFMVVCKEKPDMLPPLDTIGLEPSDRVHYPMGSGGRCSTSSTVSASTCQDSIDLDLGTFDEANSPNPFSMGNSATPSVGHGSGFNQDSQEAMGFGGMPLESVELSTNRWVAGSTSRKPQNIDPDSPELVDRKVKALLNKLTMEKFDSISGQIIAWANKSEKEKDSRTLIQVIRLVLEKATDEAAWSEMYARLCRKMMERISPKVQDDSIKNAEGKPIAGGQLFRKYVLNRCQEDFERGWAAMDAAAVAKASEDEAIKEANDKNKDSDDEPVLYSEEYYAAQKAKRQGVGLIKFIGELFKLQILTERIMHECVKKLLGNVENPEEEEIEGLCKLLTTVGQILDTNKARAHMDVYFSRMRELIRSGNVSSRMQYMLQVHILVSPISFLTHGLVPRM
jgi:translation initiation factor 4G